MIGRNPSLSPDRPYLVLTEPEPDGHGSLANVLTVFLTASECPIGCAMCDLWQNTLDRPTPDGAITRQITDAIHAHPIASPPAEQSNWIKLYNSGNFFDPRSIPVAEYPSIADRLTPFDRVIVENHPRFGKERLRTFRDRIDAPLEVAVGLETVQPRWLNRLGKQMSRDDFDSYAAWLDDQNVGLRVFLILGVPGISATEAIRWTRLSVRHAIRCGARHVSLIPARSGHGWNGQADRLPPFTTDQLAGVLSASIDDADGKSCVTMDLWDLDASDAAVTAMQQMNLTQQNTGRPEKIQLPPSPRTLDR
ncbi:hypothetical protein K227x_49790 [Rubripirellula lacrimiformis]|uniref:Elp3/MiaA/NifB-like radical SAM core domain-containing protein n=1 Tax=Rubripirellula lacrimiformis TaxID=1930273 RepID=A0A517NHF6_9BACT|nr:hypothetical protein [Rubripirellula lacrimiformis]QDT06569.1 hypothetical protein K227x_49790 [Rubripirellula lacrimiformis]